MLLHARMPYTPQIAIIWEGDEPELCRPGAAPRTGSRSKNTFTHEALKDNMRNMMRNKLFNDKLHYVIDI